MPIPTFTKLGPYPEFNDIVNKVNTLVSELQNLLLSLDTLNVASLNAEVIEAGTIVTDKLAAGAVTADKISVSELSAINANLGHITAGLVEAIQMISSVITGSLIQTKAAGNYPRVELSSSTNVLKAENDASNSVVISAFLSGYGTPAVRFSTSGAIMDIAFTGTTFNISGVGNMNIQTTSGIIELNAPGGVYANGIRIDV